jgi:hypothetical protein
VKQIGAAADGGDGAAKVRPLALGALVEFKSAARLEGDDQGNDISHAEPPSQKEI